MRVTKKDFYDNGNLRSSIQYEGDLMDGFAEYYHYNGRIKFRIPYEMGRVVDSTTPILDENGEIFRTDIWRDGRCSAYNNAGTLIGEFTLFNGESNGDERWYNNDGTLRETVTCVNGKYEGLRKLYFRNGKVRLQENYVNDIKQGIAIRYNENGSIHSTTPFVDGKAEGVSKLYNEEGILCAERTFKDDKLNGTETHYYEDGSIRLQINYKDNLMHGTRIAFWQNGKLCKKMEYNEGYVVDGTVAAFDENGNMQEIERWEGGSIIVQYDSGALHKELPYFNGRMQGNARIYYENGELRSTAFFQNGHIEGVELSYFENGTLESVTPYVHGCKHGIGKSYHKNGTLSCETPFSNGYENGTEKMWNPEGRLIWQNFYVEGNECGCKYYRYYENGQVFSEIEMTNGLPNGTEKAYYENGVLASKLQYKNGMVIDGSYKFFDEAGKEKYNITWKNNVGRAYFDDGSIRYETFNYRDEPNGYYQEKNEAGETIQEGFMFDGVPCDSFREFLDLNFDALAVECKVYFNQPSDFREDDEDCYNELHETYKSFFRDCYEKIMESEGRDSKDAVDWREAASAYNNYEELDNFPHDSHNLTRVQFIQKVVHEFILRLRLPNDGLTELNVAEELQYLVKTK